MNFIIFLGQVHNAKLTPITEVLTSMTEYTCQPDSNHLSVYVLGLGAGRMISS